jgi:DNA-binding NarL/FixJ family response regulator
MATLRAIGADSWVDQAAAELKATGEHAGHATPEKLRLSPQELQIALLAARGLSNREIGERVFLSPRTVSSHLHRVFPKLGVTARSQLAGRMAALG